MKRFLTNKVTLSFAALAVAIAGVLILWSYIFSFQTVTFHFDSRLGYIELSGNGQPNFYPADSQPVKLKKGVYKIKNVGSRIAANSREQTVNSTTEQVTVHFNYTRQYLDSLYTSEKATIETSLIARYPKIAISYDIVHDKLYHQGEIYGAVLVARDQLSDNSDTLRVLMEKKDGKWIVLTKPPVPVLGAPLYPSVDRQILADINQAQ